MHLRPNAGRPRPQAGSQRLAQRPLLQVGRQQPVRLDARLLQEFDAPRGT